MEEGSERDEAGSVEKQSGYGADDMPEEVDAKGGMTAVLLQGCALSCAPCCG